MQALIERKTLAEFPAKITNTLRLLSLNFENITPVGSFMYRSQKFGDIDGREQISFCDCDPNSDEIYEKLAHMVQNLVHRIENADFLLFSNFKTGSFKWTAKEIQYGYVQTPVGELTLAKALKGADVINVEVWLQIGDRWVEASNFIVPQYVDKDGSIHNLIPDEQTYVESIKSDIRTYIKTNVFKAMKRLWVLARLYEDKALLEELQGIIGSNLGDLYILTTDVNTIIQILENYPSKNITQANYDGLLLRASNVYIVPLNHSYYSSMFNTIVEYNLPVNTVIDILSNIHSHLLGELNVATIDMLDKTSIPEALDRYLSDKKLL